MTLKIHINGTSKKIITPLRTFVGGSLTRLPRGFTFVNGQKVQLWGNTRTQFFSIPFSYGFDNDILYIDDNYLYTYGTTFVPYQGSDGKTYNMSKKNVLSSYNISNPSTADRTSYVQWGKNPILSPNESDSNNYIFYITNNTTRNKVKIQKNSGASVVGTYNIGTSAEWCVPFPNGTNQYGSGNPAYVAWDGGNFVVYGSPSVYVQKTPGGTSIQIGTVADTRIVDGDYVFVAGYKTSSGTAVKVEKWNLDTGVLIWDKTFDEDRKVAIVGYGQGKYYVVDEPKDFNATDINVYLRVYNASNGIELEASILDYRTESDARIIGWKTTPVKAVNGVLPMRWFNSGKMYICKVFVD